MTVYEPAVPYPVILPSDMEKQAVELMAKITVDGCEEKAAELKARATLMFDKKIEPTPRLEFLERRNAEETATLEAQIAELREKSEHA